MNELQLATTRIVPHGIADYLPEPLVPVLVHTQKYSCQAYLDRIGIWRNRFTKEPINLKVLSWDEM